MPRGAGLHWDINLSEVAQLIGTVYGAEKTVKTNIYIDALMRSAHAEAAEQFNQDIAAQAVATQKFNHMYEWGTAGINKARASRRMDPQNPDAMLWRHKLTGGHSHTKGIDFTFRASKIPVPQPTTAKTKVDRKYLDKLSGRKHIFHWKAPIIEYGMKVKLKPKYAPMIFVPFYGQPRTNNKQDRKRGFLFHKGPLTNIPGHGTIQGRDLKGNFTEFWGTWWNTVGSDMIGEAMYRELNEELAERFVRAGQSGTRVRNKSWRFEITSAAAATEAFMQKRAKSKEIKEEMENETW